MLVCFNAISNHTNNFLILFLFTGLCVSRSNDAKELVLQSTLPLLGFTDFKELRNSYHASWRTTMDSSQLCTCPAVSLPGRQRHCLLIMKQTTHFLRMILADTVIKTKTSGCAGMCFANVNIFCFSSLMGLSRRFAFYTFSGMLASGKQLSNGKNKIKHYTWKGFFASLLLVCLMLLNRSFT